VREIFRKALNAHAAGVILLHNHPSGVPEPSRDDLVLTRSIKEAGEMVGIPLIDHIIIGDLCFTSLKERDML
jgi:DNA repair protein RadC